MRSTFQLMKSLSRDFQRKFNLQFLALPKTYHNPQPISSNNPKPFSVLITIRSYQPEKPQIPDVTPGENHEFQSPAKDSDEHSDTDNEALRIQNLLKVQGNESVHDINQSLNQCGFSLTEELVLNVLHRHRSDWRNALIFFNWICQEEVESGYSPGTDVYNETLDILGRMRRFEELNQMFDEMSKRDGLVNERTFAILLNRYSAAHKVDEAIQLFYRRKQLGLELDLIAFQTLLMSLCRYKHVEAAEFLFHSKKNEFQPHIKTMNIILNGWCVLGSLREAKRFWKDIISSKCKPDRFTYGIFINSLSKAGKISTAVKLFRAMWKRGCDPDVAICNSVIDGLCFKKRFPEALDIFSEMIDRDCVPNVATYNSLIKYLCKIRRMEKVYELLDEMEEKKGSCSPNAITYGYLLNCARKAEEVAEILDRMERNGCKMTGDAYNLILRLYMDWGCLEKVKSAWIEMEREGLGPDQRSYIIMVHGLYEMGRIDEALYYFSEMTSKGMVPEPRTTLLVDAMNVKLKEKLSRLGDNGLTKRNNLLELSLKTRNKSRQGW